jgi:hypothetical protein
MGPKTAPGGFGLRQTGAHLGQEIGRRGYGFEPAESAEIRLDGGQIAAAIGAAGEMRVRGRAAGPVHQAFRVIA